MGKVEDLLKSHCWREAYGEDDEEMKKIMRRRDADENKVPMRRRKC